MKIAGLVLLLMSSNMWGWQPPKPPPYSFKSAVLGMTLEQFKLANSGKGIRIPFSKVGKHGKTIIEDRVVPLPLCSDAYSVPAFDGEINDGEIVCSMSWASEPTDELDIVGLHVQRILYRFRHSLLYQIEISFDSWQYPAISKAFIEKYGTPEKQGTDNYQNVFGAHWTGNNLSWRNDREQWIAIVEGPGNGPAKILLTVGWPFSRIVHWLPLRSRTLLIFDSRASGSPTQVLYRFCTEGKCDGYTGLSLK